MPFIGLSHYSGIGPKSSLNGVSAFFHDVESSLRFLPRSHPRQTRRNPGRNCSNDSPAMTSLGAHDAALIGRNEKGVQLFHESVARQTGYEGLRYG